MIGERLKQLRIKNGLKQQELADMFGLSSGTISFYESEQRKPDIDFIVAIAKYFDVSTDYLLGLTNAIDKENIDISKVTGLNDFSLTILEQSLKETNNAAAEVIDTVICGGDFLRLVNLINDKNEKKPTIDIDWSDICEISNRRVEQCLNLLETKGYIAIDTTESQRQLYLLVA